MEGDTVGAWFVLGIFLLAIVTAAGKLFVDYYLPRYIRLRDTATATYDNSTDDPPVSTPFFASRPEVETEKPVEKAENAPVVITLTEIALRLRDEEKIEDGMLKAFAALSKGGYLVKGKETEIKKALFGVGGGRALQRLNAAIDAVVIAESAPAPSAATPAVDAMQVNGEYWIDKNSGKKFVPAE